MAAFTPRAMVGVGCLWAAAAPLGAQIPQGSPAELVRGLQVRTVRITPSPIEVTRGDTILLTVALLDSADQRVRGARFGIGVASGMFDVQSIKDSIPDSYLLRAIRPGTGGFSVFVQVPDDSAGFRWSPLDSATVQVHDWPLASIEIDEPRYRGYVGTTFRMTATPLTDRGTRHELATVVWRSEDPSVATITPSGLVSPARPGNATLVATGDTRVSARYRLNVVENPVEQVVVTPATAVTRTGDVTRFTATALDRSGRRVNDIALSYAVHALDSAGAQIFADGAFVAELPGAYEVVATAGRRSAEAVVEAVARPKPTPVRLVGRVGPPDVATSDLWVFTGRDGRDYAYTGTHAQGGGQRMFVWDVTNPAQIVRVDSVVVDARVVNDVKVNGDASWAIITREGASTRRNGIVVLDLTQPAHPRIIAELTDSLTAGIHNVWINGEVVYAVNDGTSAMHIIDMSDPARPKHVGRWEVRPGEEDKSLHDVWSDGRYAYLSYWDDGLVILDVGAGTHGGTPTAPAFVSRYAYAIGNTHTAYREGNYVFLGDEIFGCEACINGPRGYIHVVDVSNIEQLKEVAKFEVPEAGAHNIWVENGILYIAYYQGGLRIVDVSGELRGDLYRQGRQIGWYSTAADADALRPNTPMAWGPQPFKGNIFVSDMNSGLWILHHDRPERLSP